MITFFKNNKWFNAGNGCINVKKHLNKNDISKILNERNLFQIQFDNKPTLKTLMNLNKHLFSKRPDVYLRITNYKDPIDNLSFLIEMNHLKYLNLDLYDLADLNDIGKLTQLSGLLLSDTKRKSISLHPISNLSNLKYLQICGLSKDIKTISNLHNLTELVLRSTTLENLDFLKKLQKISKLSFILGGTKDYDVLKKLPHLSSLTLWQVHKLTDIEFISELKNLEYLKLDSLRNVIKLPMFTNNERLYVFTMNMMKGLQNVETIKNLQNLEEFLFTSANNINQSQLEVLKECKRLRMASVGFGSVRKNKEFSLFLNSISVEEFDWNKSKLKNNY